MRSIPSRTALAEIFLPPIWILSNSPSNDGEKYLPVNTEGNSQFEIPVKYFDKPMDVIADTTAMSEPHEIEYTLTFDSASIK